MGCFLLSLLSFRASSLVAVGTSTALCGSWPGKAILLCFLVPHKDKCVSIKSTFGRCGPFAVLLFLESERLGICMP